MHEEAHPIRVRKGKGKSASAKRVLVLERVAGHWDSLSSAHFCLFLGVSTARRPCLKAKQVGFRIWKQKETIFKDFKRLRGTTIGANNRLDVLKLLTTGVNESEISNQEDMLGVVEGWQEDETHNPDVPAISHRRGLTPFVFVPFEEVETSVLNLPVDKMDYFVPG